MAIFKCKMCGGDLSFDAGSTVCECEFCGSKQTLPNTDNEKKVNLFNRANRLRMNNEFDKAATVYESIVAEFPEEAEAYWGLCLCAYGIEYVDDPATLSKIPTCHRTLPAPIMEDPNFEQACDYADAIARRVYRDEAKAIDRIQKDILSIAAKETPYDVFICYKELDDFGSRTEDSVIAQEIYDALTEKNFKVFFSRITLEDKLGVQYEPYIYAALSSAKVMLAVGTKFEYYDAVWVKNEWRRFLGMMKSDKSKTLIPCFKDLDAYDIPKEMSGFLAQDLGKLGWKQDLVRAVEKLCGKAPAAQSAPVIQQVVSSSGANTEALLKRAFMFLEDGNWKDADEYCEKVLDQDPENAQAYLGKLMAECKVRNREQLADCSAPFDNSNNYKKATRFGDKELTDALGKYIAHINERNENDRKTGIYNATFEKMNSAATENAFKEAANEFASIPGFKDADEKRQQCLEKAEEVKRIWKQNALRPKKRQK
jgi:tetratricopeptide (TPR) repeat protein